MVLALAGSTARQCAGRHTNARESMTSPFTGITRRSESEALDMAIQQRRNAMAGVAADKEAAWLAGIAKGRTCGLGKPTARGMVTLARIPVRTMTRAPPGYWVGKKGCNAPIWSESACPTWYDAIGTTDHRAEYRFPEHHRTAVQYSTLSRHRRTRPTKTMPRLQVFLVTAPPCCWKPPLLA